MHDRSLPTADRLEPSDATPVLGTGERIAYAIALGSNAYFPIWHRRGRVNAARSISRAKTFSSAAGPAIKKALAMLRRRGLNPQVIAVTVRFFAAGSGQPL